MNNLDINPRITVAVIKAKLDNFVSILSLSSPDLERATQLSASDVACLHKAVAEAVSPQVHLTGYDLYLRKSPDHLNKLYLTTGCPILDDFLRGGILSQGITEISGVSASGKTQLCMQLSITVQLPKSHGGLEGGAVFICTEDVFPNKRLMQMVSLLKQRMKEDSFIQQHSFSDYVFIEHAADMDDMWHCIGRKIPVLLSQGRIRVIVIDSVAALFRCEFSLQEMAKRAKKLSSFAAHLQTLSSKYNVPVVCVNQVTDVFGKDCTGTALVSNKVTPSLGISWANLITSRIMLQRTPKFINIEQRSHNNEGQKTIEANVRTMEILFAPHLPNSTCYFVIDQEGVKGLS